MKCPIFLIFLVIFIPLIVTNETYFANKQGVAYGKYSDNYYYPSKYSPWRSNFLGIGKTLGSVLPVIEYTPQQSPNSYTILLKKYGQQSYNRYQPRQSRTTNNSK